MRSKKCSTTKIVYKNNISDIKYLNCNIKIYFLFLTIVIDYSNKEYQ